MFCCMNNALKTVTLGLAVLLLPGVTSAQDSSDGMLRIRSNGKTRIEIRDGNQVAVYTGGVQFSYLDYLLSADELHYSQLDDFVEAMGNVSLSQTGSRIDSDRIELHLADGLLVSPGELRGQLAREGMSFLAASASVQLSGQPGDKESSYVISLRDQVFVSSQDGYSFSTSLVTMDTGSRLINVPRQFSLRLPGNGGGQPEDAALPGMADLILSGASMTGTLDEHMQIESLLALAPEVHGEQLQFSAGSVRAGFQDNGHDGIMIDLLATGSPVRGLFRQPREDLLFSADSISGTIDPGYGSQFLLSGGINLSADLALLVSDKLSIVQDMQGLRIVFPEGLEAGMSLNVLSGNEDIDLSTILHK